MLSGVGELHNCAVMVIVDPGMLNETVELKKAAIDVIIPSRGTEKAKLSGTSVRSMVTLNRVDSEVPKPII